MIDIFRIFAKTQPYVSLFEHCCNTGKTAGKLWDLGLIEQSIIKREHLCLLAALHDIGKCHPEFQRKGANIVAYTDELMQNGYLPEPEKSFRHEIVTEAIIRERQGQFANLKLAKAFAKILRLHHQKPEGFTVVDPAPKRAEWLEAQARLLNELEQYFKVSLTEVSFEVSDSVCTMLWGIVILADWLVSGDYIDKIESLFCPSILPPKQLKDMFALPDLRPLQKKCEELAIEFGNSIPLLTIIEAPMGEGKTEAALYLAAQFLNKSNKKGFYVALPTMATARQMEGRVSDLLIKNNIDKARLVHSEAWLENDMRSDAEIDKSWFAPTKRALLSNYAVGTVDQAMMSVVKVKAGVLRLLGLSSKILIIDEIHAYDTYMQTIIFRLLEWCKVLSIPVIMLSATLPKERRKRLLAASGASSPQLSDNYPLITSVNIAGLVTEIGDFSTYMQQAVKWDKVVFLDYNQVASLAMDAIKNGGCGCIIMNTVKDSQEVYQALKDKASDIKLTLFHARFLSKDRKKIEEQCLQAFGKEGNRPPKAILVATQVAEQSLDLDFDYMISALAPIDLLLQRCGRVHRHNRKRPLGLEQPRFTVLINAEEVKHSGIGRVYRAWILTQTQKAISQREIINLPFDIRSLVEEVYTAVPSQKDIEDPSYKEWIKMQSEEMFSEGKAESIIYPSPQDEYFFPTETGDFFEESNDLLVSSEAATRLGKETLKIALLPRELWQQKQLKEPGLAFARKTMEYSVSLSPPIGYNSLAASVVECGGYLKGLYAIPYQESFQLVFTDRFKNKIKKYTISAEYGLKEEE